MKLQTKYPSTCNWKFSALNKGATVLIRYEYPHCEFPLRVITSIQFISHFNTTHPKTHPFESFIHYLLKELQCFQMGLHNGPSKLFVSLKKLFPEFTRNYCKKGWWLNKEESSEFVFKFAFNLLAEHFRSLVVFLIALHISWALCEPSLEIRIITQWSTDMLEE